MNPYIPKVRREAVNKVRLEGWSMREAARHFGISHSTVVRWCKIAPHDGRMNIETQSSRPKTSPRRIDRDIVDRIVEIRHARKRCAEVIHAQLKQEGMSVSLSTVKRTLDRFGLRKKKSPWKIYHQSGERPVPETPGKLVQMDTIHIMTNLQRQERMYIVTLIDVHSRWAYATASERLNTHIALQAMHHAAEQAIFPFDCIQSDNGPEFSSYFTTMVEAKGMRHRHTRVRKPNDNAHIERFNRTIQEELRDDIRKYKTNIPLLNTKISAYLQYYNHERLHMGIGLKTPAQMLEVVQRC
jgi:transposase InsO family protein